MWNQLIETDKMYFFNLAQAQHQPSSPRSETPLQLRRVQLSPRESPHGSPTPFSRPSQLKSKSSSAEDNVIRPISPSRNSQRPVSWVRTFFFWISFNSFNHIVIWHYMPFKHRLYLELFSIEKGLQNLYIY